MFSISKFPARAVTFSGRANLTNQREASLRDGLALSPVWGDGRFSSGELQRDSAKRRSAHTWPDLQPNDITNYRSKQHARGTVRIYLALSEPVDRWLGVVCSAAWDRNM